MGSVRCALACVRYLGGCASKACLRERGISVVSHVAAGSVGSLRACLLRFDASVSSAIGGDHV